MKTIVLASRNEGKLRELQAMLADLNLEVESQAAYNIPSAEETGLTFVENALLKAQAVSRSSQLPALADDSGLVVPSLGGEPGIYSARYAGEQGNDSANNAKLLQQLENQHDRRAYFYCACVLITHYQDPTPIVAIGQWHGTITLQPRGSQGFGYDPLFQVQGSELTSAEMSPLEKNRISHRGLAMAKLKQQLSSAIQANAQ